MAGFSVNIGADVRQLTTGLNTAKQELSKFDTAVKGTASSIKTIVPGSNQAAAALTNVGRVAQDLPFGFIGIQNNLNPLLESFQRLKVETGSSGAALKALGGSLIGAGGIGLALSIVSSAFVIFQNGIAGFNSKSKEAKERADKLKDVLRDIALITKEAAASVEGQVAQVQALANVVGNSNKPYQDRKRALEELKDINKSYFGDLQLEDAATGKLTKTVTEYTNALINSAIQKEFVNDIAKIAKAVVEGDEEVKKSRLKLSQARNEETRAQQVANATRREGVSIDNVSINAKRKVAQAEKELADANEKVTSLLVQEALLRGNLNKAVEEGLKFKDLDTKGSKKEEDLLKKRLAALEKIKDITKDATALVGLQEAIFDLQVKIAIRDQGKNKLSKQELDQQLKGYQDQLNEAFKNQAIELESIPKVKFSSTARLEINDIISKAFTSKDKIILSIGEKGVEVNVKKESVDITDLQGKIAKATGFDKKIPVRTEFEIDVDLFGLKTANFKKALREIKKNLLEQVKDVFSGGLTDVFAGLGEGLGESFAEAISGSDFGDGLKKAAQNILSIVGSVMQQLGKALIAAAIKIKLLKETFEKFAIANPALAIVAGIGLVAAGALIKNIKFDGPKFATGGIVSGPIIGQIGEMHRPEVILPLDRLPQMLRSIGGGGGNDLQMVPIINNEGLYLAVQRGARRAGRKF